jgi:DNA-directed RNA polymerase subunit RPC12/RpoP
MSSYIAPACNQKRLVRIAKRLVRYNVVEGRAAEKENPRHTQYSCEKCGKKFGAWKHLRQHKVENHSY